MNLRLVSFLATDKIKLPGLLYTPAKPTKKAAVWLHGMGDGGVFYNPTVINALGEALTERGIALLAFNNRGAHLKKSLKIADDSLPEEDQRYPGGTHYEKITDCVLDIDGGVKFLNEIGFTELYLIGHSSGANKICAYDARAKQSNFKKYVLAAPGDDVGGMLIGLGADKFWRALQYAAKAVSDGDSLKVMPKYTGMHPFSAQSAWDILNPDGDYNTFPYHEATIERLGTKPLFEEYKAMTTPTLIIVGESDEYTERVGGAGKVIDLLMSQTSNARLKQTDFILIPGADHSFHDTEATFAQKVGDWLA